MKRLFALKNGTTIRMQDGTEYVIKSIYSIFGDLIVYNIEGDKRFLTNEETGYIDDPEVTTELVKLYYYNFANDLQFHENEAWGLPTKSGKTLVFCPDVRMVVDPDLGEVVGKNFNYCSYTKDIEAAKNAVLNAMQNRIK